MRKIYNNIIFLNLAPAIIFHIVLFILNFISTYAFITLFGIFVDIIILPIYLININRKYLIDNNYNRISVSISLIWLASIIGLSFQIFSFYLLDRQSFNDPVGKLISIYYGGFIFAINIVMCAIFVQQNPNTKIFKTD